MVEIDVGDLYDRIANTHSDAVIRPEAFYECKYCPMFQISGSALRDSCKGRTHAAAHRIAFEALLDPCPVLICPICDLPQKTSDTACIFGCMFNDLDLVEHLENDHVDVLADDMICDFSDPRYLLTTFQEKRLLNIISESPDGAADAVDSGADDGTTISLSDGDGDSGSTIHSCDESELKFSQVRDTAMDQAHFDGNQDITCEISTGSNSLAENERMDARQDPIQDGRVSGKKRSASREKQVNVDSSSNGIASWKKHRERDHHGKQMSGVSVITCLVCEWSPSVVSDSTRLRDEISTHVRYHIQEESKKLPNESCSSFADQRLLECMAFSLEEYFEKEHLSDLSGTINSQIMERVYGELLVKLFGICVPLVYRILHGNCGNPFRPSEALRLKRRVFRYSTKVKPGEENSRAIALGEVGRTSERDLSISTEATESDIDSTVQECADLLIAGNFESDQHIQCARAECGHHLLTLVDRMAIVRHIAAHIRHDEGRLLNRTGAFPVVACDCGVAVGSPMGYIYHIVHDHLFETKKFSDISATIVSYIMLIVETAVESVLAVRVDFRSTSWPLWCAYFSLENDEGDESLFADSTDLNGHWLKLWEDLIDEHMTGKSMSLGDTIKLFELHPFVDEEHLRTMKHKSVPLMESRDLYRALSKIWRRIKQWENDPIHRTQLASESRWIRLAQIRRKVFLEMNKNEQQTDVWRGLTAGTRLGNQSRPQASELTPEIQDNADHAHAVDNERITESLDNNSSIAIAECAISTSSGVVVIPSSASESNFQLYMIHQQQEITGATELSGTVVRCSSCANVCVSAVDTAAIEDHCALHAVMEGRMLCSLYIHRAADRPQTCPFCHCEVNVYKPMEIMHHLKCNHMEKARTIYDRYLFHYFPQSKIFYDPNPPPDVSMNSSLCNSDFLICCQRKSSCGVNPVVRLPHEEPSTSSDVDIAVVKHILWHVRNDSLLDLDSAERDLLTRALMVRLSSSQMRQVLFMAKKVAKQFNRYKEPDVVKYIQGKMDEIGWILFGANKGLVYQIVFTRRFVRDQSGMQIYPPCVCRICVDKELPRFSSDRRKRAFVAYTHPVVLHVLEHLSARQLPEKITLAADDPPWKNSCKIDGLRFKSASIAIKHVLDAHNDLVELSALDLVLEDMGLFEVFRDALSVVLGDQAWQLEEALGFGGYKMKPCSRPNFLNADGVDHRPDCARPWDQSMCTCADSSLSQGETTGASGDSSSQFPKARIRNMALHGMPEASAACYEEFLQESEVSDSGEGLSSVATAQEGSILNAIISQMPFTSPSQYACVNSNIPSTTPLVSVKVEPSGEQSDHNNQRAEISSASSMPPCLLSIDNSLFNRSKVEQMRKKRAYRRGKQKRPREIKREIDGVVVPQRNKALPLKNVIHGSKTIAAALAAALETVCTSSDAPFQPDDVANSIVKEQHDSVSATNPGSSEGQFSPAHQRMNAVAVAETEEESDLALGNVCKRPRLVVCGNDGLDSNEVRSSRAHSSKRRTRAPSSRGKAASSDMSVKT